VPLNINQSPIGHQMRKIDVEKQLERYLKLLKRYDMPERNKEISVVYSRIACLQNILCMHDAAISNADISCTLNPYYAAAFYQKGLGYFKINKIKESCEAFLSGLERHPGNTRLEAAFQQIMEIANK